MKKLLLLPLLALLITASRPVSAKSNTSLYVSAGYTKGRSIFDVVVHGTPKEDLVMFANGKKSGEAKVNRKGWATFRKVYVINSGNLTFKQYVNKALKPIGYKKYYSVIGNSIRLSNSDPTVSNIIGARIKTSGCQITTNREQDVQCTPGAIFTNVTKTMVCKTGYSKSVRNVSSSTKSAVYREYGITSHGSGEYEIDHLVSLELGGSNSIANLWPEAASPTPGFHQKDSVENRLHSEVCSGQVSLADAQLQIINNWLSIYLSLYPAAKPVVVTPAPAVQQSPAPVQAAPTSGIVKMSSTGICHAPGTTYYDRTLNYTPFPTLQACLDAGGRLPLR